MKKLNEGIAMKEMKRRECKIYEQHNVAGSIYNGQAGLCKDVHEGKEMRKSP